MNKNIFFLVVLCFSLWSCGRHAQNTQDTATQYGEPFDKVPDPRDVVIYQVNVRAFSKEGNFKGVIARLDSIEALGVNVVYLMPIYPVGKLKSAGGLGSPYAVRDYKSVNPEFGTLEDLRTLVAEAHERDMAVMLDWVANHTAWDNGWIREHKDWYLQDSTGNITSPPGTGWNDVAQLNFSNHEMRKEMIRSIKGWVLKANIDGFRFDYANGPPFDFWKQAVDTLRAIDNHELLLLAEGDREDHFQAGFDYIFGFNFFYTLKDKIFKENRSVTLLNEVNTAGYAGALNGSARVVRYISNHDVNAYEGTPMDLFGGKQGSLATFVVAAYMKGVPMIYNGQEIGYPNQLEFFTRTPIDWEMIDENMLDAYKEIISFYNSSRPIRRGELKSFGSDGVVVFTRELEGEKVLVLSNLRNKAVDYTVPAKLQGSSWEDAFNGARLTLNNQISLEPFSYMVLKN